MFAVKLEKYNWYFSKLSKLKNWLARFADTLCNWNLFHMCILLPSYDFFVKLIVQLEPNLSIYYNILF